MSDTMTIQESPRVCSEHPQMLPYERLFEAVLLQAIRLRPGERLLVLQPFGWHIDGRHIPNAYEHFSREGVCIEHRWEVVDDYGPYIAIVKSMPAREEVGRD